MNVVELIGRHGVVSAMQTVPQMHVILDSLVRTLDRNIPGAVVELGCAGGTTSLFLGRVLKEYGSKKELHLYDSFEGLPDKGNKDGNDPGFVRGAFAAPREFVREYLAAEGVFPTALHEGWFRDIPDEEYPYPISFALFDGDFYQSVLDSFDKVYAKVSPGGIICIHDYGFPRLPGVKLACDEFLENRTDWQELETKECMRIITRGS